ncbi:insulinase family protein [Mesorhizobium sp. CCANP35]|uniref:Insulinase family protein n=1 Tax=Mesorhizobium neociceri TaxID=1307853 RepID=A0A838B8J5_9HYPH|nr:insulinase family protein [Mesorhizobium neociceri]
MISAKNTAASSPDAFKDDVRAGLGKTKTARARRRPSTHLLSERGAGPQRLQNGKQITWPRYSPVTLPQAKPSIRLGLRWLCRAFIATALALTSTTAVLAASDDGKVTDFVLDNGMQVVVIPDHRAPIVTHMVWYKVGSADEQPGSSGLAHFLEHLMFKATSNHAAGELDRAAAAMGGSINGFTSSDYTAYIETVPPSGLAEMMSFEADRMRNLTLSQEVINTERDVILEERRMTTDSDPAAVLEEEVDATLWQNQPYRMPTIGWMAEVARLSGADAFSLYDKYYQPNNAVLVVSGDVDPETVKALAEMTYGKVARGPDLPPRNRPVEPTQDTKRAVLLSDVRISVPRFSTHWVVPSYHTAKPGEAEALDLLAEILGGGDGSRLYQALVVEQGIATEAGAHFHGTMLPGAGSAVLDATKFTIYGVPRGDAKLTDLKAAAEAEVARIASNGVSDDELDRAKARYVSSMIFAQDDQDTMAIIYGSTLAAGGSVKDVQEWPDRIRKVTASQIQALAARYLVPGRSTTGYLLPKTEK